MVALNWEIAITQSNKWKESGNKIVFTNGCYDLIHRGHIDLLSQAKNKGDRLIVGINTDRSVQQLKGDDRPIQAFDDRVIILNAIKCVDMVVGFDEDTPEKLIKNVKPDIITKGGDYTVDTVVGNELAEVVIIPSIKNYSTTNTIQRINNDTT